MRNAVLLIIMSSVFVWAQTSPLSPEQRATFHGRQSEAVEPFRIVGNIYYVGARNIASYLITTPEGHIMIDTGTKEMHDVIRTNVEKLGFKLQDIKILLSGHAHFDHVQGHAAMKRLTGAKVMAIGEDARALEAGSDLSPLGDEGWEPVKVDRVLKDGDTVMLGGTTLRAVLTPGHTPGCTTWTTGVEEKRRPYSVVFQACGGPNAGVKLIGNSKFPSGNLFCRQGRTYQGRRNAASVVRSGRLHQTDFRDGSQFSEAGPRRAREGNSDTVSNFLRFRNCSPSPNCPAVV
ncbi:MAG: subclass B3 metallo-beta-lactamase [Acidobacteria bacterium]|nr:MAG: subclass B3 metallo-beta-lactamase [Acidobacteriota bacterium]